MQVGRGIAGLVWAAALAAVAGPALAQSASDFRLPTPGSSPASGRSQGPVDADNPVLIAPRPSPSQAPSPVPATPIGEPAATPSSADRPASQPASSRAAGQVRPPASSGATPSATSTADPVSSGLAVPQSDPAALPTSGTASDLTLPAEISAAPAAAAVPASGAAWWWPYLAGLALIAALLFALLWWRSRPATREPEVDFERPIQAAPSPPKPEEIAPDPAPQPTGMVLTLEARRLSASLVATTLSYRLVVTNHSAEPLSALAIEGDMISAHASLPPERQVAQPAQRLELRHALTTLAPGESAEFAGDIRLPLAAVTPIRAGDAAYFVPLARFRIEASEANGRPVVLAQTFVVGEAPAASGGGLRPFRLDLGPRTYSQVGQRLVN